MGFTIFTQSGTFNPADYGLKVGDTLHIVCVGGGGGGGCGYNNSAGGNGGNGGSSSFGSYITSLGGGGGIWNYQSARSTQGSAYGGKPSSIQDDPNSGGGAGGWVPGCPILGEDAQPVYAYTERDCIGHLRIPRLAGYNGYIVFPGSFYSIVSGTSGGLSTMYPAGVCIDPWPDYNYQKAFLKYTNKTRYFNYGTQIVTTPSSSQTSPIFCENRSDGVDTNTTSSIIPKAGHSSVGYSYNGDYSDSRCYYQNYGGVGYGAGGAGGAYFHAYYSSKYSDTTNGGGGNSGEIKIASVTLSSVNSIAVSVGGGGSGANGHYYNYQTSYFTAGNAGTASAGGASTAYSGFSNAGGYGSSPNGKTALYTTTQATTTKNAMSAGGGASGCVAIYW